MIICLSANGDIIRLKDGTSYEGQIVEENDSMVRIKLDAGGGHAYSTVNREDIRRILRDTPEERERKIEEQRRAEGLVKDGDEWVTKEVKAAREAQAKAEEGRKLQQRLKYKLQMDQLKQEQKQLEESAPVGDEFGGKINRSGELMGADLRSVLLRLAFFAVLAIVAFALLKRYFWD
jgi:hypothetical protein